MRQLRQLRRNFLSLSGAQLVSKIVGAFLYVILARYLGPEQFGVYSLAISYWLIFGLLANLGLDPLIIKDVARDTARAGTYFSHAVLIKLGGGMLAFLIVVSITFALQYDHNTAITIVILCSLLLVAPFNTTQEAIFKAFQRMEYSALINVLRSILKLVFVLIVVAIGYGVQAIAATHVIVGIILTFSFYHIVLKRNFCSFSLPSDSSLFVPLVKSASPFVFIGALYILNSKFDVLIISKLVGIEAVGFYSAASELIMTFFMIATIFSTVLFPVFSEDYGYTDLANLATKGHFAFKLLNVIGIPVGMGLFVLAPDIINLVFGPEYSSSVIVLRILSLTACFFFANSTLNWLLTAMEHVKVILKINVFALALNIVLDLILVPIYGFAAAAVGMVLSMAFAYIWKSLFLSKTLDNILILKSYIRPFLASVIMVAALLLCQQLHLFLRIGIGIVSYGTAVLAVSVFDKKERSALRRIFAPENL